MVIVFEAPDNCGKTTQIKLLNKYFANKNEQSLNVHCMTFGISDNDICEDYSYSYYKNLFKMIDSDNFMDHIILDRSWLGELIYGPIYRFYSGEFVLKLEEELKHKSAMLWNEIVLITIIDTPERIIERDDGNSFSIDIDCKENEIDLFKLAHKRSNINEENKLLITLDSTKDIDAVHKEIVEFLETK